MEALAQFLPLAAIMLLWEIREIRKDKQNDLMKERVKSAQISLDFTLAHIAKIVAASQESRDQLKVIKETLLSQKESIDDLRLKASDLDLKLDSTIKEMVNRQTGFSNGMDGADFIQGV